MEMRTNPDKSPHLSAFPYISLPGLWGPVRVNSDRRHGSETATLRSWNDDERQAAHAKLRQRQREKWNRQRHSRFKNQTATSSAFGQKKLHLLCVVWLSSVIFSSRLAYHVTHYAFVVTRSTFMDHLLNNNLRTEVFTRKSFLTRHGWAAFSGFSKTP